MAALLLSKQKDEIIFSIAELGVVDEIKYLYQDGIHTWSSKLFDALTQSLQPELAKLEKVYIVPDGMVHQIPLASLRLPDEIGGGYWIQKQKLRYLMSARDLLCNKERAKVAQGVLAMGMIDYDSFETGAPKEEKQVANKLTSTSNAKLDEQPEPRFKPLLSHQPAFKLIKKHFEKYPHIDAAFKSGQQASESYLKKFTSHSAPYLLHLDTQGFAVLFEKRIEQERFPDMVNTGLALAGANAGDHGKTSQQGEDGILFGLEVQNLNLQGTQLVVLSSGHQEPLMMRSEKSDGLFDLMRAFRIAGAQQVMMPLGSEQVKDSGEFLADFYENWITKYSDQEPTVALRATQLDYIQSEEVAKNSAKVWSPYAIYGPGTCFSLDTQLAEPLKLH